MGQFEEDEVKWVLLGSGLMVILCAGTVYAFGAFSNELKRSLQLSQTQLELGALAANLGNYIGIAGFFFDKYGAVKSSYVGAVLMGVGYGGLWLLSKTAGDLSGAQGFAALLVCCFTYGHGSSYLDVSVVATVVRAFPGHRGAVVGLLKSFYGLAASLVILFAGHVYSQSTFLAALALIASGLSATNARFLTPVQRHDFSPNGCPDENESLETDGVADRVRLAVEDAIIQRRIDRATGRIVAVALVVLAVALGRIAAPEFWELQWPNYVASVAAVVCVAWQLAVIRDEEPRLSEKVQRPAENPMHPMRSPRPAMPVVFLPRKMLMGSIDSTPGQTVRSPLYWLDIFAVLPAAGMGLLSLNNLAQIMAVRGASPTTMRVANSLVGVANCLGRLATGRLADYIVKRKHMPRATLLVASNAGGALAMAVLYASETIALAFFGLALAGFAYGALWTLIPTLVSDLFGDAHFGANYAVCLPAVILGGVIFSTYLASATYAAHETFPQDGGPPECFGGECFGGAFLASALCCVGGAAAAGLLCLKSRHLYQVPPPETGHPRML